MSGPREGRGSRREASPGGAASGPKADRPGRRPPGRPALPGRPEDDVGEELEHYLRMRARELEEEGLAPDEARREARRRFGDRSRIEAECVRIQRRRWRRERGRRAMRGWVQDLRHVARGLARTPVLTGAALVTLALGIGADTAVFSVVRGVLLRPLPFPEPGELVALYETREGRRGAVSPANYLDWRREVGGLESLAALDDRGVSLVTEGGSTRLEAGVVSGNFFSTLGVEPAVGRLFDPALRIDPGIRRVVLGHALWTTRFGADPDVVGRTLRIDDGSYEVWGVAPPDLELGQGVDLWIRSPWEVPGIPGFAGDITRVRSAWYVDVVGRLAPGTSLAAAQAELDAVAAGLREAWPDQNEGAGILATPLRDEIVGSSRPLLMLLLGAVGLVLLVACANVANLSLVRAEGRRRELSVRAALGAGEGRLSRLVLTEGLVLALAGGALGTLLAVVGLPGLLALLPADVPRRGEIALDGAVLAFTLAVSLGACLLFTVAPVVLARRTAPARVLAGRDGDGGGRGGHRLRAGLVVVEVALGLVLAAGTTAVVRSVGAMAAVEPGFRTTGLATVRASFPEAGEMSEAAKVEQWRRVVEEVAALPGIDAAGAGIASPTALGPRAGLNVVRPDVAEIEADRDVVWHPATPGYLPALGVRLLRGRGLSADDRADAPPVAVVSDRLARTFFPEEEVLGRTVTIGLDEGHAVEIRIVGVVEDTRNRGPTLEPVPVLYRPLAQAGDFGGSAMTVAAHGAADPALRLDDLEDAVRRAAPTAVVYGGAVGASLGEGYYGRHRFVLRLLGAFAVLAVALAAVGIYGVTAHGIRRRRREIGIRMALGASRRRVLGSVFRGGLGLALVGVALGGALTVAGGRLLEAFLFRAAPAEPTTLAGVSLALLLVAALALAFPGRQAVRVHPAEAIRRE